MAWLRIQYGLRCVNQFYNIISHLSNNLYLVLSAMRYSRNTRISLMRVATLFNNVAVEKHVVHKCDDDVDNLCITR